ncbi:ABC transporter ATP-binding protein/permease [Nocardia sp. NBC_01377]|uniref:ABC transporter ATP-binding protein n=1 Tax=Nocardia sp. NBC_01377 TaxID=2903595 RepID=UPI003243D8C9
MIARLPVGDRRAVRAAVRQLVEREPATAARVVLLYGAAAFAGLGPPWLLGTVVDSIRSGHAESVNRLLPAVLACALAQMLFTRYAIDAGRRFGERSLTYLREDLLDRVLALPTAIVEQAGGGDLMTRGTTDVATVGVAVREALPEMLIAGIRVVLPLAVIFVLDWRLGAGALAGVPLLLFVCRWYLRTARTAYLTEAAAGTEISDTLMATTSGARTVAALGMGVRRIGAGDETTSVHLAAQITTLRLRTLLYSSKDVAGVLPVTVVLIIGGLLHDGHSVPLGTVVAAALYVQQLGSPLDTLVGRAEQLQRAGAAMARLVGVPAAPAAKTSEGPIPADDRVRLSSVRFAYRSGRDVLRDIDLDVGPGERIAVVGPSGSGKTTLARLLAGIDRPSSGAVTVGGVSVSDLAPETLRRRIVLVTQEHHVFLGTVRENLVIAAPTADDDALRDALRTVGADWVDTLSDGMGTVLGPGATVLDAAREQQLALARIVLADPRVILLDEATSLLDPATARDAERSLSAVLEGRTVIAFAHRLHTARDADRVIVLEDGRITEQGTHDELRSAGGVYADLWHAQVGT